MAKKADGGYAIAGRPRRKRRSRLPRPWTPEPLKEPPWPPAPPTWPKGPWEVPPMPPAFGLETARKGLGVLRAALGAALRRAAALPMDPLMRGLYAPPFPGWRERASQIRENFLTQHPIASEARPFFEDYPVLAMPPWALRGVLGEQGTLITSLDPSKRSYMAVKPDRPDIALREFARAWYREALTEEERQAFARLWKRRPMESLITPKLRGYLMMAERPAAMMRYFPKEKRLGPSQFMGTPLENIIPPLELGFPGLALEFTKIASRKKTLNEARYAYLVASLEGDLRRLPREYRRFYKWIEVLPIESYRAGLWPPGARR